MSKFKVRYLGKAGSKEIMVSARTAEDAKNQIGRQGKVVSVSRVYGIDIMPGMSISERYSFMRTLSTLLHSKMGASEALSLIAQDFPGRTKKVSQDMLERLKVGGDIPSAMEEDPKNFPVMVTALVKAGFQTGRTAAAIKDAADFEYQMANSNKGAMKQVWQAIGTFITAGIMMLGTTEYFGPQVMDNPMFKQAKGVDVEWARTFGDVCSITMVILLVLFVIFFFMGTVGRRIAPTRVDNLIMKIPYYRDLILAKNNYMTFYRLGLLIQSGVQVGQALDLTEQATPKGALKTDLRRAFLALKKGGSWARSMVTLRGTDRAALSMSSDRVDIARILKILAEQYSDLYIQRINSFAPTLGMIASIFLTLAGVVLFCQTILPMLQLSAAY